MVYINLLLIALLHAYAGAGVAAAGGGRERASGTRAAGRSRHKLRALRQVQDAPVNFMLVPAGLTSVMEAEVLTYLRMLDRDYSCMSAGCVKRDVRMLQAPAVPVNDGLREWRCA